MKREEKNPTKRKKSLKSAPHSAKSNKSDAEKTATTGSGEEVAEIATTAAGKAAEKAAEQLVEGKNKIKISTTVRETKTGHSATSSIKVEPTKAKKPASAARLAGAGAAPIPPVQPASPANQSPEPKESNGLIISLMPYVVTFLQVVLLFLIVSNLLIGLFRICIGDAMNIIWLLIGTLLLVAGLIATVILYDTKPNEWIRNSWKGLTRLLLTVCTALVGLATLFLLGIIIWAVFLLISNFIRHSISSAASKSVPCITTAQTPAPQPIIAPAPSVLPHEEALVPSPFENMTNVMLDIPLREGDTAMTTATIPAKGYLDCMLPEGITPSDYRFFPAHACSHLSDVEMYINDKPASQWNGRDPVNSYGYRNYSECQVTIHIPVKYSGQKDN